MGKFIYIDVFRNKNFKCTLKWKGKCTINMA